MPKVDTSAVEKRLACPFCGSRESKSRGVVGMRGTFPDEVLVTKRECTNERCAGSFELWTIAEAVPG